MENGKSGWKAASTKPPVHSVQRAPPPKFGPNRGQKSKLKRGLEGQWELLRPKRAHAMVRYASGLRNRPATTSTQGGSRVEKSKGEGGKES